MNKNLYHYKVEKITKVVDGDTVYCTVSLGFDIKKEVKLRIERIDTPELNSKDFDEREDAKHLRDHLRAVLKEAFNTKTLYLHSDRKGKYGRYIGNIYWEGGDVVSTQVQAMTDLGLTKFYYDNR